LGKNQKILPFFITIEPNNLLKNSGLISIKTTVIDANAGYIVNINESKVAPNQNRITFRIPNMQVAELLIGVKIPLNNFTKSGAIEFEIEEQYLNQEFQYLNAQVFLVKKNEKGNLINKGPIEMQIVNFTSEKFATNNVITLPNPNHGNEHYLILRYVPNKDNIDSGVSVLVK